MPKTISTELATHLAGETTSIATLWSITRQDGESFYFTDHDDDITFGGNTYESSVGYNRTAVDNQVGLSVDNLDVQGFLDSSALTETELRAGLFDYATVRVSIVNWKDLTQGELKARKGHLGEIVYSDSGVFQTELRGLTQVYSQKLVNLYQPECRADLGDSKCKVPVNPDAAEVSTAYSLGDFIKFSELMKTIVGSGETFLAHYDATALDEVSGEVGTLGTSTSIQSSVAKFTGALEMTPAGASTESGVEYISDDAHLITSGPFTIEAFIRTTNASDSQVILSKHNGSPNRGWYFQMSVGASNLGLVIYTDGIGALVNYNASFAFAINTWYHVAVCRDGSDNVRLFVDGVQIGSTYTSATATSFNGSQPLRVGRFGLESFGSGYRPFHGFIDEVRMDLDAADYTANFTPPATPYTYTATTTPDPATLDREEFDDRIYEVTTAGTSGSSFVTFDTIIGNTTTWGSVVVTAREAWTKAAVVATVTDNREFTVTFPNGADSREVDDWFKFGAVIWDTGDNAGTIMEVKGFTAATDTVELFLPMSFNIQVGDTLGIYAGCDKKISTCINKFNNVLNFRGEPYVPGQDEALNYAAPGR